jgi:hypothetical protein
MRAFAAFRRHPASSVRGRTSFLHALAGALRSQTSFVRALNSPLRGLATTARGIHSANFDGLSARFGRFGLPPARRGCGRKSAGGPFDKTPVLNTLTASPEKPEAMQAKWNMPGLKWNMPGFVWNGPVPPSLPSDGGTMADKTTRTLSPKTLQQDEDALAAVQDIPTYAPRKPEYATAALEALDAAVVDKEEKFAQAEAALKTARDNMVTAHWNRHNGVLGMRDEVKVQYGANSNEYQAVGRKKVSEYKKPKRKTTPPTP